MAAAHSRDAAASDAMAPGKPRILTISLHEKSFFDDMYDSLLSAIMAKANLQRALDADLALRLLRPQPEPQPQPQPKPKPSAVLLTDDALALEANAHVWEAVLDYVRQGGTAIIMGHFPSFVRPNDMKPFFARAGLSWEAGSYHRMTLALNRASVDAAVGADVAEKLPSSYSQKAVFVRNVAPADTWYKPTEDSVVESVIFYSSSSGIPPETAVALAEVGAGKLGYVGDVNAEEGSNAVILAMCGLL